MGCGCEDKKAYKKKHHKEDCEHPTFCPVLPKGKQTQESWTIKKFTKSWFEIGHEHCKVTKNDC